MNSNKHICDEYKLAKTIDYYHNISEKEIKRIN